MPKKKGGGSPSAPEKKSHLAAITAVLTFIGAVTTAVLNLDKLRDMFLPAPVEVTAGAMSCERQKLTVPLTNGGRRAATIAGVSMSVLRGGVGEAHDIVVTAKPETIDPGETASVTLTSASAGIPIDFPVQAGDQCRLEIVFELVSGEKSDKVAATCNCSS